jgi:hypothetical protein
MKLFGKGWGHPSLERCDVPLGATCAECGNTFNKEDLGALIPFFGSDVSAYDMGVLAYHRDCLIKVLGLKDDEKRAS